jgi:hypothetical protein
VRDRTSIMAFDLGKSAMREQAMIDSQERGG